MKMWETERQMENIICGKLEIPAVVDDRITETLDGINRRETRRTATRVGAARGRTRGWKRAMVAAVIACAMVPGVALAAYASGENSDFYQAIFENTGKPSVEEKVEYDEDGKMRMNLPNIERVSVDEEQADALIGAQVVSGIGTYELKSYTGDVTMLDIESMLYDDKTGAFFLYMSLERQSGGFPDIEVFETGECYFNGTGLLIGGEYSPGRLYYDHAKSTENKVYLSAAGINMQKAATPGKEMTMDFLEYVQTDMVDETARDERFYDEEGNLMPEVGLEIASVNLAEVEGALDATELYLDSSLAATFSPVGLKLQLAALGFADAVDDYDIKYIALEYKDGTNYVVMDRENNIDNTDYALGASPADMSGLVEEPVSTYCFNRIVDVGQVEALVINDMVLPVD